MTNTLLLVDDDAVLLQALNNVLQEHYKVYTALSGKEALEILHTGVVPEVILSDQAMIGMLGTEFLAESREIVPDAIRVILTGQVDINSVIASVNEGHVYKFLLKPIRTMEIVQAVQECLHYYNLSIQNKTLLATMQEQNKNLEEINLLLEQRNAELIELNWRIDNHVVQVVRLLSGLVTAEEQYYYTPHAQTVASIAHALATGMGIDSKTTRIIVLAALLHDIGKIGLPERIMVADYEELGKTEQLIYQSHVEKGWQFLQNIAGLEDVAKVVLQHHENYNGTGFPAQLEEDNILLEAQIVSIANVYHNLVYKIPVEIFRKVGNPRLLVQPIELVLHRQAEAKKILYKKARHYQLDVFEAFMALMEAGACPAVQPGVWSDNPSAPLESMMEEITRKSVVDIGVFSTKSKPIAVPIRQIEMGMIAAEDILTNEGTLVLPAGSIIDYHRFQKLMEFYENRSIATPLLFFRPDKASDAP